MEIYGEYYHKNPQVYEVNEESVQKHKQDKKEKHI